MAAADVPQSNETGAPPNPVGRGVANRRGPREACHALLSGAALFVFLQLAAALAFELWFTGAIDPDYASRFQRVRQGRAADPGHTRTVVMLGSSRTYYGLEAERLNAPLSRQAGGPVSVVNFGFTGGGPMRALVTWRRLQHDGVRPDLVLIEVLPAFLNSQIAPDDTREDQMPADRLCWHDLAVLDRYGIRQARPWLRCNLAFAATDALYSHRAGIVNAIAPKLLTTLKTQNHFVERLAPDPFPVNPNPRLRDQTREAAHQEYNHYLLDYQIGGRNCQALHELLASCRRAGVPAALVLMPEGPEFRSWYPPETWRQIQNWVEQLGREEGASLINAREWIEEGDFLDSHHLLPQGADKFTDRLGRDYIEPLLSIGAPRRLTSRERQ